MTEQSHKTLLLGGVLVLGLMASACEPNGKDTGKNGTAGDCAPTSTVEIGVPSGTFIMGAHPAYAEEGPPRKVTMAAFDIDATEVTNAAFARFVEATGYVTDAERAQPGFGEAGGVVFRMPNLNNPSWWHFVAGANWRHPDVPESLLAARMHVPVVPVSHRDSQALAP